MRVAFIVLLENNENAFEYDFGPNGPPDRFVGVAAPIEDGRRGSNLFRHLIYSIFNFFKNTFQMMFIELFRLFRQGGEDGRVFVHSTTLMKL